MMWHHGRLLLQSDIAIPNLITLISNLIDFLSLVLLTVRHGHITKVKRMPRFDRQSRNIPKFSRDGRNITLFGRESQKIKQNINVSFQNDRKVPFSKKNFQK